MKENSYGIDELGIKAERFIRKYKFVIIFIIIAIVVYFIATSINEKLAENKRIQSNELYSSLLLNKDLNKLEELKKLNPNLYLALLLDEKYNDELMKFEPSKEDYILIDIYNARNDKSKFFLKDLTNIQNAYKLLKENKIKEAEVLLNTIDDTSAFYRIANNLKHYQGL